MPGKQRTKQQGEEAKDVATTPVPGQAISNSAMQDQLKQGGPAWKTGTLTPANSNRGPGKTDAPKTGQDGKWTNNAEPFSHTGVRRTSDKYGHSTQQVGVNGGAIQAGVGHTSKDGKIHDSLGVHIDPKNLADTSFGGTTATKNDRTGRTDALSGSVSRNGVNLGYSTQGERGGVGGHVTVGDREFAAGLGGTRKLGRSGSVGGSVGGGLKLDKESSRKLNDKSTGMDRTMREMMGGDGAAYGKTSGMRVSGQLNVGAGVVGVEAKGHYATESGTHFFTNDSKAKGGRDMRGSYGDRVNNTRGGGTASNLRELDLAGLNSGEGYGIQSSSSKGGGLGVSVYGIGVGGEMGTNDVQQTVVSRNDDGYLVDISMMDQQTASANVNAGGGAVALTGNDAQSQASRVRFQADEMAMAAFQRTGVLPGAVDSLPKDDPRRKAYEEVVSSGRELSEREQAIMNTLAGELNPRIMGHDPNQALPETQGASYQQIEQGKRSSSGAELSMLGLTLGDSSHTTDRSRMRYREGGDQRQQFRMSEKSDFWFSPDESANHVVNAPGDSVFSSQSVLGGRGRDDLYRLGGDTQARRQIGGGRRRRSVLSGNADQVGFHLDEQNRDLLSRQLVPDDAWDRASTHHTLEAWDTERRIGSLQEAMENGVSPAQALSFLESQWMQHEGPPSFFGGAGEQGRLDQNLQQQPSTMYDPDDIFGLKRRQSDPFNMRARNEYFSKVNKLDNQSLGLARPTLGADEANDAWGQMTPDMQAWLQSGVTSSRQSRLGQEQGRLPRLQQLGAVDSYEDFLKLDSVGQSEILSHAHGRDELPLYLSDPDVDRRDGNVRRWVEWNERKKGAQVTGKAANSYGQYVDDKTPDDARKAFERALEVKRVRQ